MFENKVVLVEIEIWILNGIIIINNILNDIENSINQNIVVYDDVDELAQDELHQLLLIN